MKTFYPIPMHYKYEFHLLPRDSFVLHTRLSPLSFHHFMACCGNPHHPGCSSFQSAPPDRDAASSHIPYRSSDPLLWMAASHAFLLAG